MVLTDALLLSIAVTRRLRVPTSLLPGVPEKVRVAGLKLSQPGSAEPSACVALKVSTSPLSTSVKVPPGTVKLNSMSLVALCPLTVLPSVGTSFTPVTTSDARALLAENALPPPDVEVSARPLLAPVVAVPLV